MKHSEGGRKQNPTHRFPGLKLLVRSMVLSLPAVSHVLVLAGLVTESARAQSYI